MNFLLTTVVFFSKIMLVNYERKVFMKKLTALFLVLLLCINVFTPAAAAFGQEKHEKCPVVYIVGNSTPLYDENGKFIANSLEVFTDEDEGGYTTEEIIATTMNILLPFFIQGLPDDEWDAYGDALYEEFAPIWDETQLDGNGNTKYGVGVLPSEIQKWDKKAATVDTGADGTFSYSDYTFLYDWRLTPYEHVDRLHEYIKTIINTTGCDRVALMGRCLGGNVINAYLDTYGSEGLVKKVVYDEVMSNGNSIISDCFSGQVDISDKYIQSYLLATEQFAKLNIGLGVSFAGINSLVLEVAKRGYDLMAQIGVIDTAFTTLEDLYNRLYTAFVPAMLRATGLATWPGYWLSVCEKDFDAALNLIFGEEGSKEREENAGLIQKLLYLRERIIKPREFEGEDNLYKKFEKDYGVEIAVIAGYGVPLTPLGVNHADTSDITVDTRHASFGATTADLFDTLDVEYLKDRVAAGYGEYISPDGKIDASTCIFPETTWFIKNKHHDTLAGVSAIANYFTQYSNVTASSNERNISRFLVASLDSTSAYENMTEENCEDGPWLGAVEQNPTRATKIVALLRFLTTLIKILTKLIENIPTA